MDMGGPTASWWQWVGGWHCHSNALGQHCTWAAKNPGLVIKLAAKHLGENIQNQALSNYANYTGGKTS